MSPRTRLIAAAILVAACLVAGAFLLVGSDGGSDEEGGLPAPVPENARATLVFLAGDGAPLLRMHERATDMPDDLSPATCATQVAMLEEDVRPNQALGLAASVPDEPIGAAFTAERAALGTLLTSCIQVAEVELDSLARQLREKSANVELRLGQLREAAQ